MDRVQPGYVQLVLHDDENTPQDFVIGLLRSVFSQSPTDAFEVMVTIEKQGKAVCGTYPRAVAEALLQAAQERIRASGHQLVMTAQAGDDMDTIVASCAAIFPKIHSVWSARRRWSATTVSWQRQRNLGAITETKRFDFACTAIEWHFAGIPLDRLVATSRQFPGHMRADVQAAVDKLFSDRPIRFFGIQERQRYKHSPSPCSRVLDRPRMPLRRRNIMMWMSAKPNRSNASTMDYGCVSPTTCATRSCFPRIANMARKQAFALKSRWPAGAASAEFVRRSFADIEDAVNAANCYRGKILSFDGDTNYRGWSRGLTVHELPRVERANVILPDATLKLLDRNILNFVQHRAKLRQLGESTRKGILLYGPPSTERPIPFATSPATCPGTRR